MFLGNAFLPQGSEAAGIDPMAVSRELMDRYGFSAAEWNYVIN